jgi:hypothetical protein
MNISASPVHKRADMIPGTMPPYQAHAPTARRMRGVGFSEMTLRTRIAINTESAIMIRAIA